MFVSKSEFAKAIGKSPALITKLIKNGVLVPCLSDDQKLIDLECGKKLYANIKKTGRPKKTDIEVEASKLQQKLENVPISKADEQLVRLLNEQDLPPLIKVQIIEKFWQGKKAKIAYKQTIGELISLSDAKATFEMLLSPLNSFLNDLPNKIKTRFPDTPNDAIAWLENEINLQKENLQGYKWRE